MCVGEIETLTLPTYYPSGDEGGGRMGDSGSQDLVQVLVLPLAVHLLMNLLPLLGLTFFLHTMG